jgi:hypothetical protein
LAWLGDSITPASNYRLFYYFASALLVIVALHQIPQLLIERPRLAFARWQYKRMVERLGLLTSAQGYAFDPLSGILEPRDHGKVKAAVHEQSG